MLAGPAGGMTQSATRIRGKNIYGDCDRATLWCVTEWLIIKEQGINERSSRT